MASAPQLQRPEGISGSALPGPFPVGAYADRLRDWLRGRAHVQLFDRDGPNCTAVAESIAAAGGSAAPFAGDVRNPADISKVIQSALARFGRVDTLVFDKTGTLTEGRPAVTTIETGRQFERLDRARVNRECRNPGDARFAALRADGRRRRQRRTSDRSEDGDRAECF